MMTRGFDIGTLRGRGRALRPGRGPADGDRGQVLVEFVLVLPILLVLVIGIIEFASAWRTSQIITNVAREGARYSVVASGPDAGDESEVETYVRNGLADAGLENTDPPAAVQVTLGSQSGDQEVVRIDYQYEFIFFGPAFSLIGGDGSDFGTITLRTSSTMRNE